jgi:hypothetical protein
VTNGKAKFPDDALQVSKFLKHAIACNKTMRDATSKAMHNAFLVDHVKKEQASSSTQPMPKAAPKAPVKSKPKCKFIEEEVSEESDEDSDSMSEISGDSNPSAISSSNTPSDDERPAKRQRHSDDEEEVSNDTESDTQDSESSSSEVPVRSKKAGKRVVEDDAPAESSVTVRLKALLSSRSDEPLDEHQQLMLVINNSRSCDRNKVRSTDDDRALIDNMCTLVEVLYARVSAKMDYDKTAEMNKTVIASLISALTALKDLTEESASYDAVIRKTISTITESTSTVAELSPS